MTLRHADATRLSGLNLASRFTQSTLKGTPRELMAYRTAQIAPKSPGYHDWTRHCHCKGTNVTQMKGLWSLVPSMIDSSYNWITVPFMHFVDTAGTYTYLPITNMSRTA